MIQRTGEWIEKKDAKYILALCFARLYEKKHPTLISVLKLNFIRGEKRRY